MDDSAKVQFDYAWKWFDLHAKQRTTLFNYFMVITGIFANAAVLGYKEGYTAVVSVIGALGAATSLAFIMFDIRNRDLVNQAEDVLEKLESDHIFPESFASRKGARLGFLLVERASGMREGMRRGFFSNLKKHKWWIRGLEGAVGACFLATTFSLPQGTPSGPLPLVEQLSRIEASVQQLPKQSDLQAIRDQLSKLELATRHSARESDVRLLRDRVVRQEKSLAEIIRIVEGINRKAGP